MAPLTWRNVEAPNFSPATDGIRTAGFLLNNAFKAAGDGLGDFQQAREQQADRDVLGRALSYSDPAALQQALSNGTIMGNAQGYASGAALRTLGNRAGDLLQNASTQQNLDKGAYDFGRTKERNELFDANGPALIEAARLSSTGNVDGAIKHLQTSVPGIRGADALKLIEDYGSQGTAGLNRARTVQSINQDGTLFDRGTEDYRDKQAVESAFGQISELRDPQLATIALGRIRGTISDRAYNALVERARGVYGKELEAPIGTGSVGLPGSNLDPGSIDFSQGLPGSGEAGNAYDTVYGSGKYGAPPKPISSMTIGEAVDFGRSTLIPNTRGKIGAGADQGTSAVGAYQFTQATLSDWGPKVFGENWQNTPMTPENQEKIARALYDDRKNGNLKDTWNNPNVNATPGYYKDKSFDEVRAEIVRGETGVDVNRVLNKSAPPIASGAGLPIQQAAAATDVTGLTNRMTAREASNSSEFSGLSDDWRGLQTSKLDKNEVLDDLTKEGGIFAGGNRANLDREIEALMQQGVPSFAVAGEILKKSKGETGNSIGNLARAAWDALPVPGRTSYIGNGREIQEDVRDSLVKAIKSGRVDQAAGKNDKIKANKDLLAGYQADFEAKDKTLQNAIRVFGVNPADKDFAKRMPVLVQSRNQAAQKLQAFMDQIAKDKEMVPDRSSLDEENKADKTGGPEFPYEQMF
jgi:hypothetical protein